MIYHALNFNLQEGLPAMNYHCFYDRLKFSFKCLKDEARGVSSQSCTQKDHIIKRTDARTQEQIYFIPVNIQSIRVQKHPRLSGSAGTTENLRI